MSLYAYFWNFGKRINSTKKPLNISDAVTAEIELKDTTSIFTPVIIISADKFKTGSDLKTPIKYNYCFINNFNRYYYVRNWVWNKGLWQCELEVDALATFKNEIGETGTMILRSASACDPDIIDTKYPTKGGANLSYISKISIWETNMNSIDTNDGFFVIGVVNNDTGALGATSYYACSGYTMREFISKLYASPAWMNITDAGISNDLQKMLINPIQYITSCMWFPFSLYNPGSLTSITTIPVGWWSISLSGTNKFYKLTGSHLVDYRSIDFAIPVHPYASGQPQYYKWLRNSPYSEYQLVLYPFGVFPLDSAKLYDCSEIRCRFITDLITGVSTLCIIRKKATSLNFDTGSIFYSANASMGIPLSLAQMSVDMSRISDGATWSLSAGLGMLSDSAATSEMLSSAKQFIDSAVPDYSQYEKWAYSVGEWFGNGAQGSMPGFTDDYKQGVQKSFRSMLSSVGKVATNIGNAVLASSGTCKTTGTNGALGQYQIPQMLICFYHDIVQDDPTHYGRPYCKIGQIKNFSGFLLCANEGNFACDCTPVERQTIVAAMTAGFYYE